MRVAGFEIPIEVDNVKLMHLNMMAGYESFTNQIVVRDDCDEQVQHEALLHEIIHAISDIYLGEADLPESVVGPLAMGLFQVVRDNSLLFRRIGELGGGGEGEEYSPPMVVGDTDASEFPGFGKRREGGR